ncbi:MAG TPA: DUF5995 family protein [Anditalea sp.]|nr:DUF5995 family protein [Anditalea sp.]
MAKTTFDKPLLKEMITIDDVLERLDLIIAECEAGEDALGYFAVMYRRVTYRIKEHIEMGTFEDNPRMEELDVVFARMYIDAYDDYRKSRKVAASWQKAFDLAKETWPITMQHLLIGMNAHINLDLGIATAKVAGNKPIEDLEKDFYHINAILASLVDDIQHNLSTIWPPLRFILRKTGKYDNMLVDFSMKMARDGAWRFAKELYYTPQSEIDHCIQVRDEAIARKTYLIKSDKKYFRFILWMIRIGERGRVSEKIRKLRFEEKLEK